MATGVQPRTAAEWAPPSHLLPSEDTKLEEHSSTEGKADALVLSELHLSQKLRTENVQLFQIRTSLQLIIQAPSCLAHSQLPSAYRGPRGHTLQGQDSPQREAGEVSGGDSPSW